MAKVDKTRPTMGRRCKVLSLTSPETGLALSVDIAEGDTAMQWSVLVP